jgi:hypothetical protein
MLARVADKAVVSFYPQSLAGFIIIKFPRQRSHYFKVDPQTLIQSFHFFSLAVMERDNDLK